MFIVRLAAGVCLGFNTAIARGRTARQVIEFAAAFAPGKCGVIDSGWFERGGRYVAEVYDWCDCWFSGPPPVLAEVIAPPGFIPRITLDSTAELRALFGDQAHLGRLAAAERS